LEDFAFFGVLLSIGTHLFADRKVAVGASIIRSDLCNMGYVINVSVA